MQVQLFLLRPCEPEFSKDKEVIDRFLSKTEVIQMESSLVHTGESLWSILVFYRVPSDASKRQKAQLSSLALEDKLDEESRIKLEALKTWRNDEAKKRGLAPYHIASNKELLQLIEQRPKTLEELGALKGFGAFKLDNFGEELLHQLN